MHFAHPLDEFYAHAGRKLPHIEVLAGPAVPQPYRKLLVHDGDMTPTLENFYDASIHLEVLKREQHGDFYFRQVVLHTDDTNQPVEKVARNDAAGLVGKFEELVVPATYAFPALSKATAFAESVPVPPM